MTTSSTFTFRAKNFRGEHIAKGQDLHQAAQGQPGTLLA
jgi:hypothetical protein